jgi:hypothetical protein
MPEGLATPSGAALSATPVDAANGEADFARMMASAADGVSGPDVSEPAAPPKRAIDTTDPGFTPKPGRGRPPKSVRARTRDAKPGEGAKGKDQPLTPKDFTADLTAVGDGLWLGLSSIPVTAPYGALVHMYQPQLVAAINQGAQVNPGVRNFVEKLSSGTGNAWILQLAVIGVNVGMQGLQIMRDPELRRQVTEANSQQVQAYLAEIGAGPVAEPA